MLQEQTNIQANALQFHKLSNYPNTHKRKSTNSERSAYKSRVAANIKTHAVEERQCDNVDVPKEKRQ